MSAAVPAGTASVARRADAQRNRERILDAARVAFAHPVADVSMAEISRRAGVGMATLYRNFPSRRDLLEALYATEADAAFTARESPAGTTPGDELRAWLQQFFAFAAVKQHVATELLTHVDSSSPVFDTVRTRVIAAGRPLLDAAQQAQQVRADLTIEQVLQMLVSIATIQGDAGYREPILATVLDGLAPTGAERSSPGRS